MKPEELLAHADFVRSLARKLVADENASADITQQAWLAAIEQPAASIRSPRAWLSRVVRNFARMAGRGEARRRRRENVCARPERIPSTEDIVQREETRRKVVDAVLALEEPYRSAIVLRFYEDLNPGEVADTLGVPLETARSRIKRGLGRMRQRLDREFGGKEIWSAALLPVAGLKLAQTKAALGAAAAGASAGATQGIATKSALYGGLVMATKTKVAIVALLVAAATITFWQMLPRAPESAGLNAAGDVMRVSHDRADEAHLQAEIADSAESEGRSPVAIEPEGTPFSGRVIEKDTGEPVTRYEVEIRRFDRSRGEKVWREKQSEVFLDEEGEFDFRLPRGGTFHLTVYSTCHAVKGVRDLEIPDGDGLAGYVVELEAGHVLSGKVVDHSTGDPVAGAIVASACQCSSDMMWVLRGREDRFNHTVTDDEGLFTLKGFSIRGGFGNPQPSVAAIHPEYAEGWELIEPGVTDWVEIGLKKGFRVSGTVLNDESQPVEGIIVQVLADNLPVWIHTKTDSDGRYCTTPIAPGFIEVTPRSYYGQDRAAFNFSDETRQVRIEDKDVEVDFGPREEHVTWRGTLLSPSGETEAGWRLYLHRKDVEGRGTAGYPGALSFKATTDEKGRFEFRKLLAGTYELRCRSEGSFMTGHEETVVFDEPGEKDKDIKMAAGEEDEDAPDDRTAAICGTVIDESTDAPPKPDQGVLVKAAKTFPRNFYRGEYDGSGGFRVEGLSAGTYDLSIDVDGMPTKEVRGIKLDKGQVIDDLVVEVPRGGTLCVKLTGFGKTGPRRFRLFMQHGAGTKHRFGTVNLDAAGEWELTTVRKVGHWTYGVEFEKLGYAEKHVDIVAGKDAEIVFTPEDLAPRASSEKTDGTVTVSGSLTRPDGTPLAGYFLRFFPIRVDGLDSKGLFAAVKTDPEGLFSVPSIKAGSWCARVHPLEESKPVCTRSFILPRDGDDPYALRFTIPAGSVHGILYDRSTGQPLPGERSECEILLLVSDDFYESRNVLRPEKGAFFVTGVPEGRYRLRVRAPGFGIYEGAWFSHPGIGDLDLGKILLDPLGFVKFKVTDPEGERIAKYQLFCNGVRQHARKMDIDLEGYQLIERVSVGRIHFELKAPDFKSWEGTIDIATGEPTVVDVSLEKQSKRP